MAEFAWDAGIVTLLASLVMFVGAAIVAIASSR
jgi:energy-converting hydrogenase Eha subunit H